MPRPPAAESVFAFRFAPSYQAAGLPFGVLPQTTSVTVIEGRLRVRFGPWRLDTPLTNVAGHELSGGFTWWKTAGPAHLSLVDHGVTFATNGDRALCVTFVKPVKVLDPTGHLRHPGATMTVADPEGLAAAIDAARG